ncbi:MAG: histidine phosphatase family protein, partial [Promicromonosporaceae bacterium]|nr:histidine phosphatase family protein [Promicromonosporaceae bacterium]
RGPLTVLVEAYDAGLLDTRALVIARHGTAIPRAGWHGTEPLRPLTPLGHGHAHALVPVLSAYGVSRVVSSEWERCAATVAPYAAAAGLTTWCSEHLSEAKHEKKPARVAATVQDLLASRRSSVLCTHRPVLPTVLDVLSEHADASVTALLPTIDPYLLPGELLVAHVARPADSPRIVAIEHVIPPLT